MEARILGLLVVVGLTLAHDGRSARAEVQPVDKTLEVAKQHFDEGRTLFQAGQYADAAKEFEQAYQAKPYPAFLYNIALCYDRGKDFAKALEQYQLYLIKVPNAPDLAAVQQRINELRAHVTQSATSRPAAEVALPATKARTKGMVIIKSDPSDAAIYIDSKRKGVFGRTPFHGALPPGQHTIIVEKKKYKPASETEVLRADGFHLFSFNLSADHYLGWIDIKTNVPGADVFFDDKRAGAVGRTRYTGFLKPGKHTLHLERRGYRPLSRAIEIGAGKEHELDLTLEKVPFGWLRVTGHTTRGARILVDGKPLACATTPCEVELSPGQYSVEVQRKGRKTYQQRIAIRQAVQTQLAVRLMPRPRRTKAWVSFGVSTAFLIGGLVCGVLSQNRGDAVQTSLPGRPVDSADSRFFTGRVLAITADTLFGLGALTGGLGLYYLFRNEGDDSYGEAREIQIALPEPRPSFLVAPSIGPGGVGLAGQVRF